MELFLPSEVITAQTLDGRKPRLDKYSGKCSTRSLLMSPEGLPLLAVCPAKHLDKTFPENFLRQRGFCQGWDYEMARAEGNASDHLPQKPTKVNLRRLGNESRREMTK